MTSAVCPVSHLSVTRRISLRHPNAFTIEHAVTNRGVTARETGIWSVMMIDTPAKIGIAMEDPTIHPVFGSAGALASKNQNGVIAECTRKQEFKIGLPNPDGETFIRFGNGGPWMHCNTPKPKQADRFAHQYPFEIFNSGDYNYCEAEWHSPQANLLPGETLEFRQEFRLWTDHNSSSAPRNIMNNKEFLSCMS
jgi:hypothetical protein